MIVKQDKFSALCINNKYEDFGNHTGFKYVTHVYKHLVIGEWYDFIKDENAYDSDSGFKLLDKDGTHNIGNGHWFHVVDSHRDIDLSKISSDKRHSLYCFFSTIAANRNKKLEELGI